MHLSVMPTQEGCDWNTPRAMPVQEGMTKDCYGHYLCTRGYGLRVRQSLSMYKRLYRETVGVAIYVQEVI